MPRRVAPSKTKANRQQIIEIARSWRGTPWRHQGSTRDGADCEGFIEGVYSEGGYIEALGIAHNWRRREDGSLMIALLQQNLDFVSDNVISEALPADILAFSDQGLRHPEIPRHLGIYSQQRDDGVNYVIHMGSETHGVVEHRMDQSWLARIHSIWRIRGIDG